MFDNMDVFVFIKVIKEVGRVRLSEVRFWVVLIGDVVVFCYCCFEIIFWLVFMIDIVIDVIWDEWFG